MTSAQRGVRLSGWLIVVFMTVMAAGQTRLGVPSYQDPGSAQWTGWAAPGAKAIGIMIVNLDNGDDEGYYASVDRAIRATRKRGIFVIGYTYTGYGARDPNIIRRKI
jgi:hypothetical protein